MEATFITDHRMWNDFIACAPTGHLCQTYEWAEHLDNAPTDSLRVGVLEDGQLLAAMLLVRSKATGIAAPFFYVPRGPVCQKPTLPVLTELLTFARNEARERGAFMIRMEPNVLEDDPAWPQVFRHLGFRTTSHSIYLRSAWVTDLQPAEEKILASMMASWRRYIRAGERNGLTVRMGAGEDDLDAFYRLLIETAERDHFYLYPKELFRDMLAHYAPERAAHQGTAEMALFLAEHEGQPIAAVTVARLGDWAWYLHGASSGLPEHRKLRPNHVLQWECMRWAKAHGAKFYDWRTIPDVLKPGEELYGVYEFKRGFGGFVRRVLPTQDLILRPAIYWPYVAAASLHRRIQRRQRHSLEQQRDHERITGHEQSPEHDLPAGTLRPGVA